MEADGDVDRVGRSLDAAAACSAGVSVYCSGGDWTLGAHSAFAPDRELVFADADGHVVFMALATLESGRRVLQSVECSWGFASPVLGPDPEIAAQLLASALAATVSRWDVSVLSGLSSGVARRTAALLGKRYRTALRPGITSVDADLSGGVDGFLGRRSAHMRSNLRRDRRRAADAGVTFEQAAFDASATDVVARALTVESISWKAEEGAGMLASPSFRAFYEAVLARASAERRLRACFAVHDGRDVGFILGAVLGGVYRGFQLGYASDFATLGLGNQLQLRLVEELSAQGVTRYDLGMAMPYKERWADGVLEHVMLVVAR